MCMYLKNQGGYKQSHFKGISYEDIRPIFERVWDQNNAFVPKDSEIEKEVMKRPGFYFQQKSSKKRSREDSDEDNAKKQKLEDDVEKKELRDNGSSKNYKIFSKMLDDFDRQDVLDLHRLVQERYDTTSQEGYNLLLWGDLKILFEPNEEDEIWKNQQDYNLISWRLFDLCGIHMLLMHTGIAIHLMIENKYPLTQEMLSKMLSRRLEVDQESKMEFELLMFIRKETVFGELPLLLAYLPDKKRGIFLDDDSGSIDSKVSGQGKSDLTNLDELTPSWPEKGISESNLPLNKRIVKATLKIAQITSGPTPRQVDMFFYKEPEDAKEPEDELAIADYKDYGAGNLGMKDWSANITNAQWYNEAGKTNFRYLTDVVDASVPTPDVVAASGWE
ncbi:hypothetical protein Tco_0397499 [Tanacetum coccineum]